MGEWLVVDADASLEEDVERLRFEAMNRFGRVDAVVNNAGGAESAPFLKTDRALWDRMIAQNATSAFLVSRAFIGPMADRGAGRIVMIASVSGKRGAPYIAAYAAAKHAMIGLMRCLAEEFGPKGVRVNAVCPGYVDTAMTDRSVANVAAKTGRSHADARKALEAMNPQKRFLKPQEVAAAVLPLLDPACGKNGEAIDL
jgi:NAD(P)-dependent dehydrogenase (short-subunit alcohol dehydrogenase family)